jgi:hypothetical protein
MAAPTNPAYVKKVLANPEPSTHEGSEDEPLDARGSGFDPGCVKTLHRCYDSSADSLEESDEALR